MHERAVVQAGPVFVCSGAMEKEPCSKKARSCEKHGEKEQQQVSTAYVKHEVTHRVAQVFGQHNRDEVVKGQAFQNNRRYRADRLRGRLSICRSKDGLLVLHGAVSQREKTGSFRPGPRGERSDGRCRLLPDGGPQCPDLLSPYPFGGKKVFVRDVTSGSFMCDPNLTHAPFSSRSIIGRSCRQMA